MSHRINKVLDIAKEQGHDTIILGTCGCGVFGNDPHVVAKLFRTDLKHYKFDLVIFAIHDQATKDIFSYVFEH